MGREEGWKGSETERLQTTGQRSDGGDSPSLSEDLSVAESKGVEDGDEVTRELPLLLGDKGPDWGKRKRKREHAFSTHTCQPEEHHARLSMLTMGFQWELRVRW